LTREELRKKAHLCRIYSGPPDRKLPVIEHYFDNKENQIALVYCPNTYKEEVHMFEPSRAWPPDVIKEYSTELL
jgi:hypothetical protein